MRFDQQTLRLLVMKADLAENQGNGGGSPASPPRSGNVGVLKRPPGRPVGSKNRVGREAREILRQYGPAVAARLVRLALGKPILAEPDDRGRRARRYPEPAEQMKALQLVIERLVPAMRSEEITGKDGAPLVEETKSPRDVARSILAVFRDAALEAGDKETYEQAWHAVREADGHPPLGATPRDEDSGMPDADAIVRAPKELPPNPPPPQPGTPKRSSGPQAPAGDAVGPEHQPTRTSPPAAAPESPRAIPAPPALVPILSGRAHLRCEPNGKWTCIRKRDGAQMFAVTNRAQAEMMAEQWADAGRFN